MYMKDKNGKEININNSCLINDKTLGLVRGFKLNQVIVLALADSGSVCNERLVDCKNITIKN